MTHRAPSAVITGSTSGIGKAIAIRLLHAGYGIVLNYAHNRDRAEKTLAECQAISPTVRLVHADIANADHAARLIAAATEEFGHLDMLINNAATVADKPAIDITEHEWDTVLSVNLKGAFLCAQHAARTMLKQESGGSIINIGASTGIRGRRNGVNTCASKAGS